MSIKPISPFWKTDLGIVQLTLTFQSAAGRKMFDRAAKEISEERGMLEGSAAKFFISSFVDTAKKFVGEVYGEVEEDFRETSFNYPMALWPFPYEGEWKEVHRKVKQTLCRLPSLKSALELGEVRELAPPIILFGCDYDAESIRREVDLSQPSALHIDRNRLNYQRRGDNSAEADYSHGLLAVVTDSTEPLMKAWFDGQVPSDSAYQNSLETLFHESMHHYFDQMLENARIPRNPRYSSRAAEREHELMYGGEFPEKVDNVVAKVGDEYINSVRNVTVPIVRRVA